MAEREEWEYPAKRTPATTVIHVRMPQAMLAKIDAAARHQAVFRSDFIRDAVTKALKAHEARRK